MAEVTLDKVVKRYGKLEVVHGIDLRVEHNEFVVLVGPSGCGKSTTLRMIAGLEDISSGNISIRGRLVNDLPPRDRNIAMVFQNYALYPHMSVRENLGFGLKIAGSSKEEIEERVNEAATILGLEDLMDRTPAALSGGQRQRVAMGRAIVRSPDVFLFDEPLSNLDAKLRTQMRTEIKKLHQKVKTTIIYVTHDQIEAMTLADRIVIMRDGYIEQIGTPLEVFEEPVNTFVATFIGSPPMNLVDGEIVKDGDVALVKISANVSIPVPEGLENKVTNGQKIYFGFRADNLMPEGHTLPMEGQLASLDMDVVIAEPLGAETLLFADLDGTEVQAKMLHPRLVQPGERLTFKLLLSKCHLFDAETTLAIR